MRRVWTGGFSTVLLLAVAGWAEAALVGIDIGGALPSGSYAEHAGMHIVTGGGDGIWGEPDQLRDEFHFAYQQVIGDATIVARVASSAPTPASGGHPWSIAGVMIRDSLADDSAHASISMTGGHGTQLVWRPDEGQSSDAVGGWGEVPRWVRLQRVGSNFSSFFSSDGVTWDPLGDVTVNVSGTVYVGLAVSSHSAFYPQMGVFDNLSITGTSIDPGMLRWDESGPDNWDSPHWLGGPPSIPDETIDVVVPTDVVTVGPGGGSALSLRVISGGGIAISTGAALSVGGDVDFASGTTLTLDRDARFAAGRGTVDSLNTAGDTTINTIGGRLEVHAWQDNGVPGALVKQGAGTLVWDNSDGTNLHLAATTLRLDAGTLEASGADPLGGLSEVTLNGGKLSLQAGISSMPNTLAEYYYRNAIGADYLDPIDSGIGYLTREPDAATFLDTQLDFTGSALNARSGGLFPDLDTIGAAWRGQINVGGVSPLPEGQVTFGTLSDDGSVVWVDVDHSGTFDAGELIVDNNGGHGPQVRTGSVHLATGTYDVAIGFFDDWADEQINVRFGQGADVPFNNLTTINPADGAQAGLWTTEITGTLDMGETNVRVTTDSELAAVAAGAGTTFGELIMAGGVLRTLGQGRIRFTRTTVPAETTGTVGFDPQVDTDYGVIDVNSANVSIAKAGSGTWLLETPPQNLDNASWRIEGGTLEVLGATGLGGRPVTLAGGRLAVVGTGVSYVHDALGEWWFDGYATEANIDPIDSGIGLLTRLPDAVTLLQNRGLNYQTGTMDPRSGGVLGGDDFGAVWLGQIHVGGDSPLPPGEVTFGTRSDDGSTLWLDLNGNGTFESDELLVDNNGLHSTWTRVGHADLAEGSYDIAIGYFERDGDDVMEARYLPGWSNPASQAAVDALWLTMAEVHPNSPSQSSLWTAKVLAGPDMSDLGVTVEANSELSVFAGGAEATYGPLTMRAGVLTISGTSGASFFATRIDPAATAVGFNLQADTRLGPLDGGSASVTISKAGPVDLVLGQANVGLERATFAVQEGRLIGVHVSNPFGTAAARLEGGELVLASGAGDVSYDNAVTVEADSVLTAGRGDVPAAHTGPLTVTLGSTPDNGLRLNSGALTLRSLDDYVLDVVGDVTGEGGMVVSEGEVVFSSAVEVGSLELRGGTLRTRHGATVSNMIVSDGTMETRGDLNVATMRVSGGEFYLNGNDVVVGESLITGRVTYSTDPGNPFRVSGSDLLSSPNLQVTTGQVTITADDGGPATVIVLDEATPHDPTFSNFTIVPSLSDSDYADVHSNNAVVVTSSPTHWLSGGPDVLVDGRGQQGADSPGESLFSDGPIWVMLDLRDTVDVTQINTYSRHEWQNSGDGGRTPQVYSLYGSDATTAPPRYDLNAWNHIADVDTVQGSTGTKHPGDCGVSIQEQWGGVLGQFRYLLLNDLGPVPPRGGTFYGEFDVVTGTIGSTSVALGELTIAAGTELRLDIGGGVADFESIDAGHDASIYGHVRLAGSFAENGRVGTLNIGGRLLMEDTAQYVCELDQLSSDLIVTTADIYLGGALCLRPLGKLDAVGDAVRTILRTSGESGVYREFADAPTAGDHLGFGVFLNDQGFIRTPLTVGVGLFQAADGDADGDQTVDQGDVDAILTAGKFATGILGDWTEGDFTGELVINGDDIQALLATNLLDQGPYDEVLPGGGEGALELLITAGGLLIDTHGETINGYVLTSAADVLTGEAADNLGLFQEDEDGRISGNLFFTLSGTHLLGDVVGEKLGADKLPEDLTFTYTIEGESGIYRGNVVIPEPSTAVLLAAAGFVLLLRKRRRRRPQ